MRAETEKRASHLSAEDQIVQSMIHSLAGLPQEGNAYQQAGHDAGRKEEEDRYDGVAGRAQHGIYSHRLGESAPDSQHVFPEPAQDHEADQHGHDENEPGDEEFS